MYIPYKRVRIPFTRQGRRVFGKKMNTSGVCVTEILILKLKPQAEVTVALLGKKFVIKRINDALVKQAFVFTEHIGFVDHRVFTHSKGAGAIDRLWEVAVEKCEHLNGERLPSFLREIPSGLSDGAIF